jgi:hypothetical protein
LYFFSPTLLFILTHSYFLISFYFILSCSSCPPFTFTLSSSFFQSYALCPPFIFTLSSLFLPYYSALTSPHFFVWSPVLLNYLHAYFLIFLFVTPSPKLFCTHITSHFSICSLFLMNYSALASPHCSICSLFLLNYSALTPPSLLHLFLISPKLLCTHTPLIFPFVPYFS